MRKVNFYFTALVFIATFGLWAALSRTADEAPWPATVSGFAFSPLRAGQAPEREQFPSLAQLDADLALLARRAHAVRTYSLDGTLAEIPRLAARHGLAVTVGAPLTADRTLDASQLRRIRNVAATHRNVTRVIIGSETLLRGEISVPQLGALLDGIRREIDVPVGTAEPWHIWMAHPELARHVDFIGVHLLPYWEGVHVEDAVPFVLARLQELRAAFPGLPVVVGEVGWPSFGRARADAVPSRAAASTFLRRFLQRADREGLEYFLMEAFDQPWKRSIEGEVGAYWGVYDVGRQPKYAFDGEIVTLPAWRWLALASALIAAGLLGLLTLDGRRLHSRGRLLLAGLTSAVASVTVASLHLYAQQYWSWVVLLGGLVLVVSFAGIGALALVDAHEWAEARWSARRRGPPRRRRERGAPWPSVSIHVPIHCEPPEMVFETLRALAALDYPHFEVLVIDNNTDDERLWRPVESACARFGERFRFFHVLPLPGYKAGALNFALRNTSEDAQIVAVIDSDYTVDAQWLRDLVPQFADPTVAIVQAPQAYRDGRQSLFKTMCNAEYSGFFKIGMVTRNDRNAIIQHGTMTMIRKPVLEQVGGWAEWTVTEDAELGLRVFEAGHRATYSPESYGKGLTPDNFFDYKTQRFRWALGAVQILKAHGKKLCGLEPSALDWGQRYHFVAGWLGWIADGLNLLFSLGAVLWSALMIAAPDRFLPPLGTLSAFVLALFAFKLAKIVFLYRSQVGAGLLETFGAVVSGLALVHTVGRAVLTGLLRDEARFLRTPKLARNHSVAGAITAALPETLLALALLGGAAGVAATAPFSSIDRTLWCILLVAFAVPNLAALFVSLASALPIRRGAVRVPRLGDEVAEARRSS